MSVVIVDSVTRVPSEGSSSLSDFVVLSGCTLFVHSGGTANRTTVNKGGSMYLNRGGFANTVAVDTNGRFEVSSGGTASGIEVSEGASFCFAVVPDTYVQGMQGGSSFEMKDGLISGYAVSSGRIQVSGGGVMNDAVVNSKGAIWISRGGIVSGATVNADGSINVSNGAILNDAAVKSGGALRISEGGRLTGKTTLESGAFVSANGGVLDFDLTKTSAGGAALVNDLSLIKGNAVFTLTVSGLQDPGVYSLAAGAAGFAGTITVQNTYGADIGTLTVGQTVYIGKDAYTLNLSDGDLSVTIEPPTVTLDNGDVKLANAMPKARYMYGCCPTSVAMLLGYYDLYGYRGDDFSALIEGDVELDARGSGNVKYKMDDFESNLGKATATKEYLYRFYSHESVDSIVANPLGVTPTSPEDELPYSFVNDGAGPEIRTDLWNCLADYLGTGQFWRMNVNLETTSLTYSLEMSLLNEEPETIIDEATQTERTIMMRDADFQCGVYRYVQDKGYSLDMKVTECHRIDAFGGDFTFEDYRKEIDAGRPALILIDGHIMVGYGYNAETREIIFDDCYESDRRMVWDGTYNYAGADRKVHSIATVGVMRADKNIDLAVSPFDEDSGITDKLIVATAEGQLESVDYCFVGSPLYLSLAVSNLGTTASGVFDVMICCDDEEKEILPSISLDSETIRRVYDIPIAADFGVGLHSIGVLIDPDNEIQETAALNNSDERSVMVLKEGTNVVEGTRTVASGEVSKDDYVMNGAGIQVLEGGTAEATLIQGKVTEKTYDGHTTFIPGIVNVSGGGLVRSATVYEYGQLQLSGTAEDLDVREHGNAVVFSGGTVSGASVDKDGIFEVEAGGKVTGRIDVESGASVGFEEGGILNFDLTQTTAGAEEAILNDWSVLQGAAPLYTLTVNGTEEYGIYTLAAGAAKFNDTISVVNGAGESIGTLTLGETTAIGGVGYLLTVSSEILSVEVGAVEPGPDWTFFNGSFDGGGKALLAVESDGVITIYADGAEWGNGLVLDPGWEIAGVGDFDGDKKDDFLRVNEEGYVVGEISNGDGTFAPQVLNFRSAGWSILGTGDFDGNGADDVLIANPTAASETVGLLGYWKGGTEWTLINGYSAEWDMVATGDFNHDGKCDMLWRNSFTGEGDLTYNAFCTWIVDPPAGQSDWRMVSVANPAEWNFLCSGDFDGDGTNDIAMINNEGVVGIWGVEDGYLSSWSILSAVTSEWTLAGVGDFNADGTDDIAWCNDSSGLVGYWQIENKELASWQTLVVLG